MRVSEAIDSRISCRAFRDTPVPKHLVVAILEAAKRAPSGGNLQPWRVDVLTGAPLGLNAFLFLLVHSLIRSRRRMIAGKGFAVVWIAFMLVVLSAGIVSWLVASLHSTEILAHKVIG